MILGAPDAALVGEGSRATLDDLFRTITADRPDRIALTDPANRAAFTDGAPKRLTYAEADRVIGAIAGRLRRLGLPADAVIALQLPNTVEAVLTILGVLRAGMIAAPLPLLWRRIDAAAALRSIGAKAIVTTARVGTADHGALAMEIAAELFSIRHVCSFGDRLGDGVLPLDDLFEASAAPLPIGVGNASAHVALVSFDVTPQGIVAVARSHDELIAGGTAALLGGGVAQDAAILTPCPPDSFAGICLGLMSWLLTGGRLALHQPFDAETFAAQCRDGRCDTVVVPGPLLPRFAEAGLLDEDDLRNVLALWRAPERLANAPVCRRDGVVVTDVLAFGEIGLVPAQRNSSGAPTTVRFGPLALPDATPAAPAIELLPTLAGTLALRGAMVPRHPFPPGIERSGAAYFAGSADTPSDTGYPCRNDAGTVTLTGPPPGLIGVGGYRFVLRELQDQIGATVAGASFAALPDALLNHRLAGDAADRAAAHATLTAHGVNALVAGAFAGRDATVP